MAELADDDGPDPVEAAIEARLRWAGHAGHQYTWHPTTGLVYCLEDDLYVGSVNPDHLSSLWTGDPQAVRSAVDALHDDIKSLRRHLMPYVDQDLETALRALDIFAASLVERLDEVMV
jgi:hypothetical protein